MVKPIFLPNKSIALLAKSITFMHPVKKEMMTLEIDMPSESVWGEFQ